MKVANINKRSIGDTSSLILIDGYIYDKETTNPIEGVTIQVVIDKTGSPVGNATKLPDNSYEVWTDQNPYLFAVVFKRSGYKTTKIPFVTLHDSPDVYLEKGTEFPLWMIGAVLGAVYIYQRKKKKVGFLNMADLMPIFMILGGIIAFDLIKKILEKLGLWKSKDTKDLDNEATDPESAWSPTFYKLKPPSVSWTYPITTSTAVQYAKDIYDSFGAFNDCEECAKAVFKKLRTKSNLSYLAEVFETEYDSDLLDFVRGGWWPQDRLSDADVAEINNYIKSLPNW